MNERIFNSVPTVNVVCENISEMKKKIDAYKELSGTQPDVYVSGDSFADDQSYPVFLSFQKKVEKVGKKFITVLLDGKMTKIVPLCQFMVTLD